MANGPEHSMASWDGRLFLKSAHWASESCLSETRFLKKQRKKQMLGKPGDKRSGEQTLPTTLQAYQWKLRATVLQGRCPLLAGFLVTSLINERTVTEHFSYIVLDLNVLVTPV